MAISPPARRDCTQKGEQNHAKPGGAFYFDVFNLRDTNEWGPNALAQFNALRLDRAGYDEGDFHKKTGGEASAFLHYFKEEELVDFIKRTCRRNRSDSYWLCKILGQIFQEKDKGSLFVKARKGA